MIKIGLVGEAPSDTVAIANLLKQHCGEKVHFFEMLSDVNGDVLETPFALRLLRIEFERNQPDLVIYIRDLDDLESNKAKIRAKKDSFKERRSRVEGKAVFLLIIFEIEALILADPDGFFNYLVLRQKKRNPEMTDGERMKLIKENRSLLSHITDPMLQPEPKEILIERFDYNEAHLARISEHLRLDVVLQNHRGFALFFKRFLKKIRQIEVAR